MSREWLESGLLTWVILLNLPLALWAPSNNTMGIRIPPQAFHTPIKHKYGDQGPDPHSLTSAMSPAPKLPATKKQKPEDTADLERAPFSKPETLTKRSKGKSKHQLSGSRSSASPKRHGRGRPRKVMIDPQTHDFSAHVFVEIANPPKYHRGKTHKTDKYVQQGLTSKASSLSMAALCMIFRVSPRSVR